MSEEIKEARKLKCVICRKVDNNLRIPMQCNVGDEGMHAELKQLYTHVTDVCTKAMHVGCELTLHSVLIEYTIDPLLT